MPQLNCLLKEAGNTADSLTTIKGHEDLNIYNKKLKIIIKLLGA